jgi:hypothetical protein
MCIRDFTRGGLQTCLKYLDYTAAEFKNPLLICVLQPDLFYIYAEIQLTQQNDIKQ